MRGRVKTCGFQREGETRLSRKKIILQKEGREHWSKNSGRKSERPHLKDGGIFPRSLRYPDLEGGEGRPLRPLKS